MHNINPGIQKPDKIHQKSIFSCNVYKTNNQPRHTVRPTFKSSSHCSSMGVDPEILYVNEKMFTGKPKTKKGVRECSTQTSKTVLELARLEAGPSLDAQNQTSTSVASQPIRHSNSSPHALQLQVGSLNLSQHRNKYKMQKGIRHSKSSGDKNSDLSNRHGVVQNTYEKQHMPISCNVFQNHNSRYQHLPRFFQSQEIYNVSTSQKESKSLIPVTHKIQLPTLCLNQAKNDSKSVTSSRNQSASPMRIGFQIEIEQPNEPPTESGLMSPDSLTTSPKNANYSLENCPYSVASKLSGFTLDGSCHEQDCLFSNKTLTQTFLDKHRSRLDQKKKLSQDGVKSKSFIDNYQHPNYIHEAAKITNFRQRINRRSSRSLDLPDNSFLPGKLSSQYCQSTFMCPTKASQRKSVMAEIQSTNSLIPPVRRGRSTSPKVCADKRRFESSKKIPYIDQSKSDISSSTTLINATRHPELMRLRELEANASKSDCSVKLSDDGLSFMTTMDVSNSSINDNAINTALAKLEEVDWRLALRGLAEIVEICRIMDAEIMQHYMGTINKRLITLLRSPRSHVCRTACQAAGNLFEYVKDTRRPLFDEIVDILLHKTADANKFIRHDANMALDCMVTHVPTFNSVRALVVTGPNHKNPLVRCATARLLVCVIVIAGADNIFNPNNNESTRKRIILTMASLLDDKNLETRKLAERVYKVLSKDVRFDVYLKKYLEREHIVKIKKTLRLIHKK